MHLCKICYKDKYISDPQSLTHIYKNSHFRYPPSLCIFMSIRVEWTSSHTFKYYYLTKTYVHKSYKKFITLKDDIKCMTVVNLFSRLVMKLLLLQLRSQHMSSFRGHDPWNQLRLLNLTNDSHWTALLKNPGEPYS